MYVGRIVAIGCTGDKRAAAMYRVSSRSFPNRQATVTENAVAIVPKPGFENDVFRNPYIAYNCLRLVGPYAVATNGSQTDPIAEKLEAGLPMRDALVTVLHAMDYEHDSYNTPRIAAVIRPDATGYLGIVRHDAVLVREFSLAPGTARYLCTYEHNSPADDYADCGFDVSSAEDACAYVLHRGVFAQLERPVSAACALADAHGAFSVAVADA
jgi:IMP cyclohydrolase